MDLFLWSYLNDFIDCHINFAQLNMDTLSFLLQEYAARKEHILNLEIRLFTITLVLQFIFLAIIFIKSKSVKKEYLLFSTLPFFFLLFESIAINGKMGLISNYLKQFEAYLATRGAEGLLWESKALEQIIFPIGNAFTLPAMFAIILLLVESYYILDICSKCIIKQENKSWLLTIFEFIVLLYVTIKSLTVDFFHTIPSIFN